MRKPSLTVDTFVAALAVLGAAASATSLGCSKSENASVAPEPAAAAPNAQSGAAAAPPAQALGAASAAPVDPASNAPAAPTAAPADQKALALPPSAPPRSAVASPVAVTALDGGVKAAGEGDAKKKVQMACGAGTCSADMKKGTGN